MAGFQRDPSTVTVAVFGAGVCGLTAAHELARRGFQVSVYDAAHHAGGLAWSKTAQPPSAIPKGNEELHHPGFDPALPSLYVEHGFRFFPGFYRHLFDTMERTPLQSDRTQSVADRLIAVTTQGVAMEDGREYFTYGRHKNTDLAEVLDELATAADYLGASLQDIARLLTKVVEYLTTSPERRADLEDVSWWDFLDGTAFSPGFAKYLDRVPRALVGMSAKESDARTQGTITAQLMLDQLSDGTHVDRVLDGPTIERWIDPWTDYLSKDLGVTFHFKSRLTGFTWTTAPPAPGVPRLAPLNMFDATVEDANRFGKAVGNPRTVQADVFVLAIPMAEAQKLVGPLAAADVSFQSNPPFDLTPSYPDLPTGARVVDHSIERLQTFPRRLFGVDPDPNFTWMFGMQFFLRDDLPILRGHLYYPDSAWGLSSVSQPQFWADDYKNRLGKGLVGGSISVDIGDWNTPASASSPIAGLTAAQANKTQFAEEVWRQLRASLDSGRYHRANRGVTPWPGQLPDLPLYWFIGEELWYPSPSAAPSTSSPFLINRPGEYRLRPGTPGFYRVHLDQFVLAGNWMATHTRLNTMEAANESARHAVNAILRHTGFQGDFCTIWNPEHCEPGAFDAMQRLDARLHAEGLPHVFDAVGVYCGIESLIPTGCGPALLACARMAACMGRPGTTSGCGGPAAGGPLNALMRATGLGPDALAAAFGVCAEDLVTAERQVLDAEAAARHLADQDMLDHLDGRPRERPRREEPPPPDPEHEADLVEQLRRLRPEAPQAMEPQLNEPQLHAPQMMDPGPEGLAPTVAALRSWAADADPEGLALVEAARLGAAARIDRLTVPLQPGERAVLLAEAEEAAWQLRVAQGSAIATSPLARALAEAMGDDAVLPGARAAAPPRGMSARDAERRGAIETLFAGPLQPLTWAEVASKPAAIHDERSLLERLPQPRRIPRPPRHPLSRLLAGLQDR